MPAIIIPEVSFSLQAVIPNSPGELHEAIDLTPELISFCESILSEIAIRYNATRDAERLALRISDGESSWKAANGPQNALRADRAALLQDHVRMLARGNNHTHSLGWIDRRDWDSIVREAMLEAEHGGGLSHPPGSA